MAEWSKVLRSGRRLRLYVGVGSKNTSDIVFVYLYLIPWTRRTSALSTSGGLLQKQVDSGTASSCKGKNKQSAIS